MRDNKIAIQTSTFKFLEERCNPSTVMSIENTYVDTVEVYNDNFEFDYKSIMIYPSYSPAVSLDKEDAKNETLLRTMLIRENKPLYKKVRIGGIPIGIVDQRTKISKLDIKRVNKVYPNPTCPAN